MVYLYFRSRTVRPRCSKLAIKDIWTWWWKLCRTNRWWVCLRCIILQCFTSMFMVRKTDPSAWFPNLLRKNHSDRFFAFIRAWMITKFSSCVENKKPQIWTKLDFRFCKFRSCKGVKIDVVRNSNLYLLHYIHTDFQYSRTSFTLILLCMTSHNQSPIPRMGKQYYTPPRCSDI